MAAILIQRCSASKHAGHRQNYAPCAQSVHTRGRVAATYPWDMYPQHFHVCANVVILFLLHVPATRPCYMSPQCVLHKFLSLQHVAATCPCNMTPRVCPPLNSKLKKISNATLSGFKSQRRSCLFSLTCDSALRLIIKMLELLIKPSV